MTNTQEVMNMKLSDLRPDKLNPRQEFVIEDMARLEESINKRGILNPLLVEQVDDGFLIVDGERRYRVAKRLGMTEVPVRITGESLTDKERLLVRFNLQEVHSPWTAWDKSIAVSELQELTGWNTTELARQLGVSVSSVNTLLALRQLAKRTISIAQKAKLPTMAVAKIGATIKHMTPEKADAVEEAYVAGVESGKIFDKRTSNKFLIATKRSVVAQLRKFAVTKKYTVEDILKENHSEHSQVEEICKSNFSTGRSMARRLTKLLMDNPALLVTQHTFDLTASTMVAFDRLLKTIGARVEPVAEK